MKFHMNALTQAEVATLIDHQMKTAGAAKQIFNENACKVMHSLSGGIVRKIGKLVDKSISLGVSLKKDIITEEEVLAASKEL